MINKKLIKSKLYVYLCFGYNKFFALKQAKKD